MLKIVQRNIHVVLFHAAVACSLSSHIVT